MMATGAGDGARGDSLGYGLNLLIDKVGKELQLDAFVEIFRTDGEKACGDEKAGSLGVIVVRKQVAGDLLNNKPVKRNISIHCINDIVTIAPGVGKGNVRFFTARLGKASHVEPVAAP